MFLFKINFAKLKTHNYLNPQVSNRKYILSSSSDDFSSSDSDAPQSHKSNNKHIKSPPGSATKNKKSPNSAQKIGEMKF